MSRGLPIALSLVMLLAGCAGQETRVLKQPGWQAHSAHLQLLNHWIADGKLALRTSDRSESANIRWQQAGVSTRLQLSGPMGFNATEIRSNGKEMEMRQGETVTSWDISTADAIERNTGWDLPLQALPYWLKGLPAPDVRIQALELDPGGSLLSKLQQDGWLVLFERYKQFGDISLPTRLRIQRGTTTARVIIRDWQGLSA